MVGDSRPSGRRGLVVSAVVVAALVAGVFMTRTSGDGPAKASRELPTKRGLRPANGAADSSPSTDAEGEPGAVDAALRYASASQGWLYLTNEQIRAEVADVAAPNSVARLSDDVVAEVSMVRPQLAGADGRVWWVVRPLAWRVDRFGGGDARVAVWLVTVLSAAGIAAPQAEFATVSLDLEWLEGRWRVSDVSDRPGPTPITGAKDQPWDAEPFDDALDGFTRLGEGAVR